MGDAKKASFSARRASQIEPDNEEIRAFLAELGES
jgi:hypothetical protein